MKFFFCEKCGKRLTDADVSGGQARDKKLKGVFCSDCSVGILTMEHAALTEDEARVVLTRGAGKTADPAEAGQAAAPAQAGMKFFFCEKCGARLTDREIAGGQAKDKKLRGVFCTPCSEGVLTMETMPMTQEQAREMIASHAASAPKRPSSEQNISIADLKKRKGKPSSKLRAGRAEGAARAERTDRAASGTGSAGMVYLLIGVAVALVLGVLLVSSGGSEPTVTAKGKSGESASASSLPPAPLPSPVRAVEAVPRNLPDSRQDDREAEAARMARNELQEEPEAPAAAQPAAEDLPAWFKGFKTVGGIIEADQKHADRDGSIQLTGAADKKPGIVGVEGSLRVPEGKRWLRLAVRTGRTQARLVIRVNGAKWVDDPVTVGDFSIAFLDLEAFAGKEFGVAWGVLYLEDSGRTRIWQPLFESSVPAGIVPRKGPLADEAVPSVAPVAEPKPAAPQASQLAAYVRFQRDFVEQLRAGDTAAARKIFDAAARDAALKSMSERVTRHALALQWLEDLDKAVTVGAEKLKDVDLLELKMKTGKPMKVGKRTEYQILSFKDGAFQVGTKQMSMALKLDNLHPEMLAQLRESGLGEDGAGWMRRAFARFLGLSDPEADLTPVSEWLEKARTLKAPAEELAYLADLLETESAERAAAVAFTKLLLLFETSQWQAYQQAYTDFKTSHAHSLTASEKLGELESRLKKAVTESKEPFKSPLKGVEDLDWEAYGHLSGDKIVQFTNRQLKGHNDLIWLLWTEASNKVQRDAPTGIPFDNGAQSHLRFGFTRPIPVSTIVGKALTCTFSVLKPNAPYPGDLNNEDHWIAARPIAADDQTVFTLPPGTLTRALRVSNADGKSAWFYGARLIAGLYTNVARGVRTSSNFEQTKTGLLVNGRSETRGEFFESKGWDNGDQGTPQAVSDSNQSIIMLYWDKPVQAHALLLNNPGFDHVEVYTYDGPDAVKSTAGAWTHWGRVNCYNQFPRAFPLVAKDVGKPMAITGLRLVIPKPFYEPRIHPNHTNGRGCGGKRVWLDEVIVLGPVLPGL
ncbi:MAG: helix-turn-helix domain-containing protein [Planctomycetes bacterium]|nr:helix-turn-helix domain-containing protein [Planctomycetota bacterium]